MSIRSKYRDISVLCEIAAVFAVLSLFSSLNAQDTKSFEVVSIVPIAGSQLAPAARLNCVNGRFLSGGFNTTEAIFEWAYGLTPQQVGGKLPTWFNDLRDTYRIEAKAAEPVEQAQCKLMVRKLFEERFHVRLSHQSKEVAGYALVIDKGNSKLREVPADSPPGGVIIQGHPYYDIDSQQPSGWTMQELAQFLSRQPSLQQAPVIDRTGLPNRYLITLTYNFLSNNGPMFTDDSSGSESTSSPTGANGPTRPSLFIALREQMGLKLESIRTIVDFVTIDHIDRPDPN